MSSEAKGVVQSRDGVPISFSRAGGGPVLILVDGALCYRAFGMSAQFSTLLSPCFTVITYDRRGRGESGDARPYAVQREVEDLGALITAHGGAASLVGFSSGAALALEAARCGLPISRLVMYEPPFIVDDSRTPTPADFVQQLDTALEKGRPGEAVAMFMRLVQMPALAIAVMRLLPAWSKLKAVAHTLPYDMTLMIEYQRGRPLPEERWAGMTTPTLLVDGGKSPAWMRGGVQAAARAIPGAQYRTLPGQTHMVKPGVLAPLIRAFLLPPAP